MTEIEPSRIYSSSQLNQLGYSSNHLTELIRNNELIRLKRGFYLLQKQEDPLELIIQLFPEAILCLQSALYYHGYIAKKPELYPVAVHKAHNRLRYANNELPVRAYFRGDKYIDLGVIQGDYHSHMVWVYDKERTMCDCLRRRDLLDKETYRLALHAYATDPERDIERLIRYADRLHIGEKMKLLAEAWL